MIHVDTSFLIRSLVAGSPEAARMKQWLEDGTAVEASTVCWTEFLCGPLDLQQRRWMEQALGEPIPLVRTHAERAAELFNSTGRRRGSLLDCMIAATALESGATIATSNRADFQRFISSGLRLESV